MRASTSARPLTGWGRDTAIPQYVELLVVDEAERLAPAALEHLRDRFDRNTAGNC